MKIPVTASWMSKKILEQKDELSRFEHQDGRQFIKTMYVKHFQQKDKVSWKMIIT